MSEASKRSQRGQLDIAYIGKHKLFQYEVDMAQFRYSIVEGHRLAIALFNIQGLHNLGVSEPNLNHNINLYTYRVHIGCP